ncbi:KTSC domain-containing protein [Anaeroarcus burkinensis]|uniref:KTSC domain-containing protein n=1 Tax=Anaeroarcus burkinensis TaxID=82376 RepID=UPI000484ED2E|nr:KTSC domain-containing protein [Anaeroarcus burkinensis]
MDKTSTNLKHFSNISYNSTSYVLEITFDDGSIHRHPGISQTTHDALMSASSPEQYYQEQLKKIYPFQKIVK